ncbi:MAG: hypothetical protein V3V99_03225 [candidate division Zixibacteria bacterium]
MAQPTPTAYTVLGKLKMGDTGLSVNCSYDDLIRLAMKKACEVGGDAILITSIEEPNLWSSCYRIKADIIAFSVISDWPKLKWSIADWEKYFLSPDIIPDKFEGFWNAVDSLGNISDSATIKNGLTRRWGNKFAIKRMPSDAIYQIYSLNPINNKYAESSLVAILKLTPYSSIYTGIWYSDERNGINGHFLMHKNGLLKFIPFRDSKVNVPKKELTLKRQFNYN